MRPGHLWPECHRRHRGCGRCDHQQHRRHHLERQQRGHRRLRLGRRLGWGARPDLHGAWRHGERHHPDHQFCGDHQQYDGIHGAAKANANGYGSYAGTASKHGSGTGGTAVAGVVITNNAGGTIVSSNGEGIHGYALARPLPKAGLRSAARLSPARRSPTLRRSPAGMTVSTASPRRMPPPIPAPLWAKRPPAAPRLRAW